MTDVKVYKNEFDYYQVDPKTADILKQKSDIIRGIVGKVNFELGKELKEAQDALAKYGYGCFEEWYLSIGLSKRSVYNYLNAFSFVQLLHKQDKHQLLKILPADLMYEAGKPNADPHIVQAVINGEITNKKQFKQAEKSKEKQVENNIEIVGKSLNDQMSEIGENSYDSINDDFLNPKQYDSVILNVADSLQNLLDSFKGLINSTKISINNLVCIGQLAKEQQEQLIIVIVKDHISNMYFNDLLPSLILLVKNNVKSNTIIKFCSVFEKMYAHDIFVALEIKNRYISEYISNIHELDPEEIDIFFWEKFMDQIGKRKEEYKKNDGAFKNFFDFDSDLLKSLSKPLNSHKVLGIPDNATREEVKKRYRQLSRLLHPDTAKAQGIDGTEYLFQIVKDAYETIIKN